LESKELVAMLRPHVSYFAVSLPEIGEVTTGGRVVSVRKPIAFPVLDGEREDEGFYVARIDDGTDSYYVDLEAEEAYPHFKDIFIEGKILVVSGFVNRVRKEIRITAYNIRELGQEEPALI
jgi:hypothetical protein